MRTSPSSPPSSPSPPPSTSSSKQKKGHDIVGGGPIYLDFSAGAAKAPKLVLPPDSTYGFYDFTVSEGGGLVFCVWVPRRFLCGGCCSDAVSQHTHTHTQIYGTLFFATPAPNGAVIISNMTAYGDNNLVAVFTSSESAVFACFFWGGAHFVRLPLRVGHARAHHNTHSPQPNKKNRQADDADHHGGEGLPGQPARPLAGRPPALCALDRR